MSTQLAVRDRLARHTNVIWTTIEGERIPITQMETSHLFNAMKMCFNHLAAVNGGIPVWFTKMYSGLLVAASVPMHSKRLAVYVWAMMHELDQRDDLPVHYIEPLEEIRGQIMPKRLEAQCQ